MTAADVPVALRRLDSRIKLSAERVCRMCERDRDVRPLTRHHLVPSRWFRHHAPPAVAGYRNAKANVVPLCRPCHVLVESPDPTIRIPARRMLRRALSQAEIAFIVAVRGKSWLDRTYPPSRRNRRRRLS